jgi:hypothetical protein
MQAKEENNPCLLNSNAYKQMPSSNNNLKEMIERSFFSFI